ncbi:type II secretion system F family protein [Pseudalkalibacillus berkeleyi]|uniref:Type II secretion system F family protein n=1 Tax=Pseudalkalibacillus berkeleyi TaxID=1069813 RepID=A0ABS9H788_9BACL|nr:type II secretion system F family protein [Pseudalkalibacillus berkeleyi]MCF6139555.1 type II secretion system F family protein [Pseudalkalibacillus berkeleyi]
MLPWIFLSASFCAFILSAYYFKRMMTIKKTTSRAEEWFEDANQLERKSFVLLIGDRFDQSELSSDLKKKLVQANIQLQPSEYMGIYILTLTSLWFFNYFILGLYLFIGLTISYLITWLASKLYLSSRQNKRNESFNQQLPEICRMMANAVKAGQTIPQGIAMVGNEVKAPSGPEFKQMDQQLRLGDDLDEVMDRFRERVSSNEINIFVSTVLIQRRVGGNLAEILDLMAGTLEERARVYKEIQTVTAESKSIAYILVIMPLMMAVMMNLFIKGFLNVLFTTFGLILLAVFACMIGFAFILIKRITRIRV